MTVDLSDKNPSDNIARYTNVICRSLWRSVIWSRVSNAADMSTTVRRIAIFPELMVSIIKSNICLLHQKMERKN